MYAHFLCVYFSLKNYFGQKKWKKICKRQVYECKLKNKYAKKRNYRIESIIIFLLFNNRIN